MRDITRPGVLVQDRDGTLGITTDAARKRTPQIAVQWVGSVCPVLVPLDRIRLAELPSQLVNDLEFSVVAQQHNNAIARGGR